MFLAKESKPVGLRSSGALFLILAAAVASPAQQPSNTVTAGMAERKLANVDIKSGRYSKPADLHKNGVLMENDANGLGGGDESVEWDTPACHVRVLSKYADPNGPRSTYSVTVTRPEDQPSVSQPEQGSCATARGVTMGDPASKAIATYGSRVTITPGKKPKTTLLHWEWKDGTTLELTLNASGNIIALDLTAEID